MAKFKNLDLLLQEEQWIKFGDDGLVDPAGYPAINIGTEKALMGLTTISGYNTTLPGSGITNITPVDELILTVPVAGERATEPYHLVRYDQLLAEVDDHGSLTGLGDDDHLQYILVDGSRGFTSTVSGVDPVLGSDLVTKDYVDAAVTAASGTHGDLVGLEDDDHLQYILVDGTRGFTGTVSGIDPTEDYHLTTKWYVDDQIATISGITTVISGVYSIQHSALTGLTDPNVHPASSISVDTSSFNNLLSSADDDVQKALETLDDALTTLSEYVTITGSETITGDKVWDNTLNTFLGNVFFDGITITMSGTTVNTEAGAVFNYDSTATINNDATNNFTSNSSITTSGTDIDFGDGTTVNFEDGSTETYEGGSETFHNSGSEDTYLPGSIVTFSGSDVNYDGNTDINYGPSTTTTNEGDTTFVDGSTTTFSGTTCFESDINFGCTTTSGLTMDFGDNTVSGTGNIYAGNLNVSGTIVDSSKKWGREAVINGAVSQAVTFDNAFADDDYTLVATLTNEVDSPPSIYSTIQGVKTASGFTTHFSGEIDSSNFILEWYAFKGTQDVA